MSDASLRERIAAVHSGTVDGPGLLAAFRDAIVLVPTDANHAVLTFAERGIQWIPAFTDTAALARFAVARGDGQREWSYLRAQGARVQDTMVPALGPAAGVAVDVGSERPVFFPPANPA